MTITTTISVTMTEQELAIIRSALCNASMRELSKAHEVKAECFDKGIEDTTSHIWMTERDKIRAIIDAIDKATTT